MTYEDQRKKREQERAERESQLDLELDKLEAVCLPEELDKRFLKNFGCINFQSDEFYHELNLARKWHARKTEKHPKQHKVEFAEPYRCYHETFCHCGFKEACDSSD